MERMSESRNNMYHDNRDKILSGVDRDTMGAGTSPNAPFVNMNTNEYGDNKYGDNNDFRDGRQTAYPAPSINEYGAPTSSMIGTSSAMSSSSSSTFSSTFAQGDRGMNGMGAGAMSQGYEGDSSIFNTAMQRMDSAVNNRSQQLEAHNENHNINGTDASSTQDAFNDQGEGKGTNKAPEIPKKKRVSDINRMQKVLEELSTKFHLPDQASGNRCKRQRMGSDARALLLEYAKEMSSAILEESCLLAKHRKSKEVNIADVKLIFGKKFRLDVSGYQARSSRVGLIAIPEDEDEVEVKMEIDGSRIPAEGVNGVGGDGLRGGGVSGLGGKGVGGGGEGVPVVGGLGGVGLEVEGVQRSESGLGSKDWSQGEGGEEGAGGEPEVMSQPSLTFSSQATPMPSQLTQSSQVSQMSQASQGAQGISPVYIPPAPPVTAPAPAPVVAAAPGSFEFYANQRMSASAAAAAAATTTAVTVVSSGGPSSQESVSSAPASQIGTFASYGSYTSQPYESQPRSQGGMSQGGGSQGSMSQGGMGSQGMDIERRRMSCSSDDEDSEGEGDDDEIDSAGRRLSAESGPMAHRTVDEKSSHHS